MHLELHSETSNHRYRHSLTALNFLQAEGSVCKPDEANILCLYGFGIHSNKKRKIGSKLTMSGSLLQLNLSEIFCFNKICQKMGLGKEPKHGQISYFPVLFFHQALLNSLYINKVLEFLQYCQCDLHLRGDFSMKFC